MKYDIKGETLKTSTLTETEEFDCVQDCNYVPQLNVLVK